MSDHISKEEWLRFFSTKQDSDNDRDLRTKVIAHLSSCEECRNLYTSAMNVKRAVRDRATNVYKNSFSDSAAFQAVASSVNDSLSHRKTCSGSLSVEILVHAGKASFQFDTLETSGCAEKYALNETQDKSSIVDDGDLLSIILKGRNIEVLFKDGAISPHAVLDSEDGSISLPFTNGLAVASLPVEGYCSLDITLTE